MVKIENSVAKVIKAIGVLIIIIGIAAGIVLGNVHAHETVIISSFSARTETSFNWLIMLTAWVTTFVVGILFIGVSEIIRLLHIISVNSLHAVKNHDVNTNNEKNFSDESKIKTQWICKNCGTSKNSSSSLTCFNCDTERNE
jgi:hypothetical protein